jgi:hypothetical protein
MCFEGCEGHDRCGGFEAFEGIVKFAKFVQLEGKFSEQVNRLRREAGVMN